MRANGDIPYPFWGAKPLYSGGRRISLRSSFKELEKAGFTIPCSGI